MSALLRYVGLARSLAMYYGIPFRTRRLTRFYAQFVPAGALCFDVGAHAGNRLRAFRRLGARVVAVEPQPDFFRLLQRLYGRDPNVVLVPAAVGRLAGTATLLVSDRTPTVTTLSPAWLAQVRADPSFAGVEWRESTAVPVTTLQALIERHGTPDFVKIDIEGYEAEALAGLERAVRALSFEYLAAARGIALDCIDRLATLGDYRYNWSRGETHRLIEPEWLAAAEMRTRLSALPERAGSGDVYARL
jgi:FkbM family methyltransferase